MTASGPKSPATLPKTTEQRPKMQIYKTFDKRFIFCFAVVKMPHKDTRIASKTQTQRRRRRVASAGPFALLGLGGGLTRARKYASSNHLLTKNVFVSLSAFAY